MDYPFIYSAEPFTPTDVVLTILDTWAQGTDAHRQRQNSVLTMLTTGSPADLRGHLLRAQDTLPSSPNQIPRATQSNFHSHIISSVQ